LIEKETVVSSEEIFSGRVVTLRVDTVRLPDGRTSTREVVFHRGAVAIVPFLDDDTIVMVRQYRRAVDEILLELPAGTLEQGEPSQECARRELEEETGYKAATFKRLFEQYLAPGYSSEKLIVFEARGLTSGDQHPDEDESLEIVLVPVAEVYDCIARGDIKDAKSIAGLLMALRSP